MRATAKSPLFATLAVIVLHYDQTAAAAGAQSKSSGMTAVTNTVTIQGPPKAVFADHHRALVAAMASGH
jgi:hypothetical protein